MATETQQTTALEIRRKFDAPATAVFEAWTQPWQMQKWLAPTAEFEIEAENDLRVGGVYRIRMKHSSGGVYTATGEYRTVEPPHRLEFDWSWEENDEANGSFVSLEITDVEGGCELMLRHERLASDEARLKHEEGWNGCLSRLVELV